MTGPKVQHLRELQLRPPEEAESRDRPGRLAATLATRSKQTQRQRPQRPSGASSGCSSVRGAMAMTSNFLIFTQIFRMSWGEMDHLENASSLLELILRILSLIRLGRLRGYWTCNWKTFFIIFLCNHWGIGCPSLVGQESQPEMEEAQHPTASCWSPKFLQQYWNLSYCIYTGTYRYQGPSNRNHVLYIIQFQYPSHSLYSVTVIVIVMSVMFTDIRREHHRSLRHGKLDHIPLMEILYADDMLLITKNTRAMNRLLHAVEDDSQYCGLNPNKSKCAVISTTGRHAVKFKDGTPVPHEDQVTYLAGTITCHVDIRAEIANRISTTMNTWKRMHMFKKNTNCSGRWKLVVYNSMIRFKLLYGMDTVELTNSLLSRLESFQLRGLRKILGMNSTFIDRRNTNAEVCRRAN